MSESGRPNEPEPFVVKDCTLTALATGEEAQTLREFRERIRRVPESCLYYHFWGHLLRPLSEEREFNNDFAQWAAFGLRDQVLAERLALVDPADYGDGPLLREEILDLVEERLHEDEGSRTTVSDEPFRFMESQLVVFDTHRRARTPAELSSLCPELSESSIFLHLVDARQQPPRGMDDFQLWLGSFGDVYDPVCERLARIDLYFATLADLREDVAGILSRIPDMEVS